MAVRDVVVVAVLVAGVAGVACSRKHRRVVPEVLRVPAGQRAVLTVVGRGTQVYVCKTAPGDAGLAWVLEKPVAELVDGGGKVIGKHYAGPTWESTDGSSVVGSKKQVAESPDGAIPWLLLEAKSSAGQGVFSHVTWIQRLNTQDGRAPAAGCDAAHAGAETAVPYRATYVFHAAAAQ